MSWHEGMFEEPKLDISEDHEPRANSFTNGTDTATPFASINVEFK